MIRKPVYIERRLTTEEWERDRIFQEISEERYRQDFKWGRQNHRPIEWLPILGEEFGEVNREVLEEYFGYPDKKNDFKNYRAELIQLAAVAVAMVECLDRNVK